jgi:hypothetical protein
MFVGFIEGESYVKMKKPGKKKSLVSSWKGPYFYEISKWEGFS